MRSDRFDSTWIASAQVIEAPRSAVSVMIRKHYLGKWPGVCRCVLALLIDGEPMGCIVYAEPPAQSHVRFGGKGFELARLWVDDSVPRNAESWFIAQSVRFVKRKFAELVYLVSYADPSAGHRGTIYRAANWVDDGRTDAGRKTPRCDYVDSAGKKYSRRSHVPSGAEVKRVPRMSKFRYVYWLSMRARKHYGRSIGNTQQGKIDMGARGCAS